MEASVDVITATCPVCDGVFRVSAGVVVAEIVKCRECGSELEVKDTAPLALVEAPSEEEDWGE